MASITDKLKKTIIALDEKQLTKALYLTERRELSKHHEWIKEAAKTCVENKDNPKVCDAAIKEARDKVKATVTVPMDTTDLGSVEEYLKGETMVTEDKPISKEAEVVTEAITSEEPKPCDVCMIAGAVGQFGEISDSCDGEVRKKLAEMSKDVTTTPEKWINAMTDIAQGAICNKEAYVAVLSGLTDELQKMDSPILKNLDGGNEHGTNT